MNMKEKDRKYFRKVSDAEIRVWKLFREELHDRNFRTVLSSRDSIIGVMVKDVFRKIGE
jgi:hypothetical protein